MRAIQVAGVLALALSSVGCATMISPGPDYVPINSTPPGAELRLDGTRVGKTPTLLPISRSSEGLLEFELQGYEIARVDLNKVFNGWFALNLLWGWLFPIPMGIDIVAGNTGKFSSDPVNVELVPKNGEKRP